MEHYIKNIVNIVLFVALYMLSSCTEDGYVTMFEPNGTNVHNEWHTAKLNTDISTNTHSRATENVWVPTDNDLLCIQFSQSNAEVIKGYALYDSTSKSWTLYYQGSLEKGKILNCNLMYFGNTAINLENFRVNLNDQTPVFTCKRAEYSAISDDIVDLYAELEPDCFRLRFKGDETIDFQYRGPFIYDSYSLFEDEISSINSYYTPLNGKLTQDENGFFSPYYYCEADYMVAFRVKYNNKVYKYKQDLYRNKELTHAGQSNLMLMPSIAPENWYEDDYWEWKDSNTHQLTYYSNETIVGNLHSKVGLLVKFSHIITSLSSSVSEGDYVFDLVFEAYDVNGSLIKTGRYYLTNWIESSLVGEQDDDIEYIFVEDADMYVISIQTYGVKVTVSDFEITTF